MRFRLELVRTVKFILRSHSLKNLIQAYFKHTNRCLEERTNKFFLGLNFWVCVNSMVKFPLTKPRSECFKALQTNGTPPIAEIICVKNVRAIVVCGFLLKWFKKKILKVWKKIEKPFRSYLLNSTANPAQFEWKYFQDIFLKLFQ